ncbi:MAG: MotA/TolQ/ExbB proton channel family protein [Lentisphaeria bacterium]|nr:MotA/TolQ/ExbB proton channel family protein [Lentisphaeria bacterium]
MKLALSATIPAAAAFLAPVALLADTAETDAPAEEMTIDWIQEIINGGMTSAVLLLLSAAAVGFLVERLIRMRKKYLAPAYYTDFFADAIAKNDVAAIRKEAETKPSILADAGAYIVEHRSMDPLRLQTAVADAAARAIERHRQRSYPLAIIATMAPMLGLLGTVIGMIEAFSKVAILGDTGDAALLADSISKALITTDMGLVLAIPALGAYHYLKQKLSIAELAIEENLEAMFAALDAQKK